MIAARAGALPETCGDAALLVDPTDPGAVAAAAQRLLDDSGLAAALRGAGPVRAAAFTWPVAAGRLADLAASLARSDSA